MLVTLSLRRLVQILKASSAGKGACSHQYSQEHHTSVVNIDIGGGTSNLAVFREGDVIDTGCFDIGGRLIKMDPQTQRISYIAPKTADYHCRAGASAGSW